MDGDSDVEGDLEALDPPHTDPWSIQRPRRRRKSRIIVALAGLVTVAIFVSVVVGIRESGRTASSVRFCLSLPLTGKLTYFPATSRRSLGHLGGEVSGFPPNDYVEANLLDSRRPGPVYLDNGLMGPEVVDRVGFQTKPGSTDALVC